MADSLLKFFQYVTDQAAHLLFLSWDHIIMVLCGLALAVAVGVPLGVVGVRHPKLAGMILAAANVIQVFPSLALLAMLMIFFGLGFKAVVIALFLYSLLPITRNTYVGLRQVDQSLIEAGTGSGMSPLQLLFKVQLPLAFPFLMAGLRLAAVIAIGVATLAPLIGGDGLGREIYSGLSTRNNIKIYAGAIPAALLAILVDIGLGKLQERIKASRKTKAAD